MNKEPGINTDSRSKQGFFSWPRTRLGWWAVGLVLATLLLPLLTVLVNALLTSLSSGMSTALGVTGLLVVLCGIAGGIIGVIVVLRKHERSVLVWLAILVGLSNLFLVGGEFLFPH